MCLVVLRNVVDRHRVRLVVVGGIAPAVVERLERIRRAATAGTPGTAGTVGTGGTCGVRASAMLPTMAKTTDLSIIRQSQ
jgi:hypothetical protein